MTFLLSIDRWSFLYMKVSVTKERYPNERRVALIPANVPQLAKIGAEVVVEAGAGTAAGFSDQAYRDKGATVADSLEQVLASDVIVQVRSAGADQDNGEWIRQGLRGGQIVIGACDPLGKPQVVQA
jgi:H+-translocating NAD(P) transhydrogenase subunit alpha